MDWDEKDEWEEDFSPRDSEGRLHGTNYSFYETGGVCEKTNWHHGVSEGLQEWFYANGKPQKRCTHKNGLRCGRHTEWYVDGTKKIDCFYENNECIGESIHYSRHGRRVSHVIHLDDGEVINLMWSPPLKDEEKFEISLKYGVTKWLD